MAICHEHIERFMKRITILIIILIHSLAGIGQDSSLEPQKSCERVILNKNYCGMISSIIKAEINETGNYYANQYIPELVRNSGIEANCEMGTYGYWYFGDRTIFNFDISNWVDFYNCNDSISQDSEIKDYYKKLNAFRDSSVVFTKTYLNFDEDDPSTSKTSLSVRVYVFDKLNRKPLQNVPVEISGIDIKGQTDSLGLYKTRIPPGQHIVFANNKGVFTESINFAKGKSYEVFFHFGKHSIIEDGQR